MFPCTWAVYEDTDRQVFVVTMNKKLMAPIMPGGLGEVLTKAVREEEETLSKATGKAEARR